MQGRSDGIALESLRRRSPARAALMIKYMTAAEQVVVIQDARTGELVVPPAIQPTSRREVACLSPAGRWSD